MFRPTAFLSHLLAEELDNLNLQLFLPFVAFYSTQFHTTNEVAPAGYVLGRRYAYNHCTSHLLAELSSLEKTGRHSISRHIGQKRLRTLALPEMKERMHWQRQGAWRRRLEIWARTHGTNVIGRVSISSFDGTLSVDDSVPSKEEIGDAQSPALRPR